MSPDTEPDRAHQKKRPLFCIYSAQPIATIMDFGGENHVLNVQKSAIAREFEYFLLQIQNVATF